MKPVKEMKKTTKKSATPPTSVAALAASKPAGSATLASKPAASASFAGKSVVAASKSTTTTTSGKTSASIAAPGKSGEPKPTSTTTIEAKIDVGFGNQLFIRGQGEGLSWDRGIPLQCVDSQTWRLVVPAKDKLQIKLLINDSVWAKGEDVVVTPGKRVELVPAF